MVDIKHCIDSFLPGESSKLDNLDEVEIERRYIQALEPNPDQVSLYYQRVFHRSLPSKASLCVIPGYGESSVKYNLLAGYMAARQIEVHMIDPRCYGYSTGIRRSTTLFEIQKDISVLLRQPNPDLPCFLLAHSLGALVTSTILINNPHLKISGVIISAAFFQTNPGLGASFSGLVLDLIRPIFKNIVFKTRSSYESISTDTHFMKDYLEYENIVSTFNFDYGSSILSHLNTIMNQASQFKYPVLFCHGDLDILIKASVAQEFFHKASSIDKTFKLFSGARHEILNDVTRYEFLEAVFEWICKRTGEPLGQVGAIEIGVAGLPKPVRWPKYLFLLSVAVSSGFFIKSKFPSLFSRLRFN